VPLMASPAVLRSLELRGNIKEHVSFFEVVSVSGHVLAKLYIFHPLKRLRTIFQSRWFVFQGRSATMRIGTETREEASDRHSSRSRLAALLA